MARLGRHARLYQVPGWPSPVLAVVSGWGRADGITVDPSVLFVVDGRLEERLDFHLDIGFSAAQDPRTEV
jgi:hypothetical protein